MADLFLDPQIFKKISKKKVKTLVLGENRQKHTDFGWQHTGFGKFRQHARFGKWDRTVFDGTPLNFGKSYLGKH